MIAHIHAIEADGLNRLGQRQDVGPRPRSTQTLNRIPSTLSTVEDRRLTATVSSLKWRATTLAIVSSNGRVDPLRRTGRLRDLLVSSVPCVLLLGGGEVVDRGVQPPRVVPAFDPADDRLLGVRGARLLRELPTPCAAPHRRRHLAHTTITTTNQNPGSDRAIRKTQRGTR